MSEVATNICPECGFDRESAEHKRGKDSEGNGLHGHERTSVAEADRQRADVMERAAADEAAQQIQQMAGLVHSMNADDRRQLRAMLDAADDVKHEDDGVVIAPTSQNGEAIVVDTKPLSRLNKSELEAVMIAEEIPIPEGATRSQLQEAIVEARARAADASGE